MRNDDEQSADLLVAQILRPVVARILLAAVHIQVAVDMLAEAGKPVAAERIHLVVVVHKLAAVGCMQEGVRLMVAVQHELESESRLVVGLVVDIVSIAVEAFRTADWRHRLDTVVHFLAGCCRRSTQSVSVIPVPAVLDSSEVVDCKPVAEVERRMLVELLELMAFWAEQPAATLQSMRSWRDLRDSVKMKPALRDLTMTTTMMILTSICSVILLRRRYQNVITEATRKSPRFEFCFSVVASCFWLM